MTTTPSLESVLQEVLDSRLADVHTALPGKVIKYDATKQVADIQPMIQQAVPDELGNITVRALPVLPSVPVAFPAGGGFFLTFPVVAGDTGLLVFCELPLDRWRATGQESHPADVRRHHVTAAVFYPGLRPTAAAHAADGIDADLVLGGPATIHLKPNGEVHLGAAVAADFVALAGKVKAQLDAIQQAFDAHTHNAPQAPTGTLPTLPPLQPMGPLQPVAATKVLAT